MSAYANEERRLGELDLVCASGPAVVLGEPQLLAQAVLAMLAHAGAAPSRQGPVLAVAEDHDGWVTISVGPSGDTTEQELFDWFDALSLESRAARVGLTCAREIARLHGGTLGLSCRTERELMLTLRLPATRAITAG
ncbi:MAG: HAMP domain-containing histidine kinase [Myxococcales bacterium]|nr:HAMP domain-containing histidine kinase [Myxococcales bacterium]